jgi:hypothetical protein
MADLTSEMVVTVAGDQTGQGHALIDLGSGPDEFAHWGTSRLRC